MTDINLLPWRETKREQEKKFFVTLLSLGFVTALFFVGFFNYCVSRYVDSQSERNQRLKNEIALLDRRLKDIITLKKERLALIARMQVVENLEYTRPLTIHLFDEVIKIMPTGVVVTKIERKGNEVTLWGTSESNTNISDVMRNIEKSQWIKNPDLTEIKKATESKKALVNEFKLSFVMRKDSIK
jgi:type IV pilus assembly protein PilN